MPTTSATDLEALLGILAEADEVALAHFHRGVDVRHKADGSPVTDADLACDRVLTAGLARCFPADRVWSEESGASGGDGPYRWVVDPIDGTSAFVEGLAHWGPTLARIGPDGRVVLAATSLPRLRETWSLQEGVGYFQGGRLAPLAGAGPRVVYVPSGLHKRTQLQWAGRARCLGGTAAHLALVARGAALAVVVGPDWQLWDVAAGLGLIDAVRGSARRVSDGAPLHVHDDVGKPFVAGNPEAVERLLNQTTPLVGGPDAQPRT